ncbi:hypothetical protein [Paenibacillus lentus]|uniref:YolD-like family protein n=1 Tax=Paenibacillus lentus TaxID=1338368 RepID=A0A3Q8SDH3_9BACL|nr:hypothetical protein [Paenibacillus lentus]AZK48163.1 hypothetical protein EIM92_19945 [Paenibacillus lentus]
MDNHNNNDHEQLGYLFNVEILVKSKSNAVALQSLLQLLNSGEQIIDYRINSGIELGEVIDSLLAAKKQSIISRSYKRLTTNTSTKQESSDISHDKADDNSEATDKTKIAPNAENSFAAVAMSGNFQEWIQKYISENRLVRLLINRNGERVNIPCRILNFQVETYTINVYHVDEKQVYTFTLSEVIDFMDA